MLCTMQSTTQQSTRTPEALKAREGAEYRTMRSFCANHIFHIRCRFDDPLSSAHHHQASPEYIHVDGTPRTRVCAPSSTHTARIKFRVVTASDLNFLSV